MVKLRRVLARVDSVSNRLGEVVGYLVLAMNARDGFRGHCSLRVRPSDNLDV